MKDKYMNDEMFNELMESICRLMEEKSLYLDSDLKKDGFGNRQHLEV